MKKYLLYSLLAGMIVFYSCKKDSSNTDTSIKGTYEFKYLTSKTNSTITDSDGGKSVTTSDYTTINNQGTIAFDGSNITTVGVTYTVDAVAKVYFYQDNQFLDSSSYPFNLTIPPISAVASYKLVGADSIYFPQGSLTTEQYGSSGGHYTLNGTLLTITQTYAKDSTYVDSGTTYQVKDSAVSSMVMQKQ